MALDLANNAAFDVIDTHDQANAYAYNKSKDPIIDEIYKEIFVFLKQRPPKDLQIEKYEINYFNPLNWGSSSPINTYWVGKTVYTFIIQDGALYSQCGAEFKTLRQIIKDDYYPKILQK